MACSPRSHRAWFLLMPIGTKDDVICAAICAPRASRISGATSRRNTCDHRRGVAWARWLQEQAKIRILKMKWPGAFRPPEATTSENQVQWVAWSDEKLCQRQALGCRGLVKEGRRIRRGGGDGAVLREALGPTDGLLKVGPIKHVTTWAPLQLDASAVEPP